MTFKQKNIDYKNKLIYYKINLEKGGQKIKKLNSTQNWLHYDKIFKNGIILSKNNYLKILKVIPICYDLKSNFEKESILNSYKAFFQTCNFDSQILIQSKKENLYQHFSKLKKEESQKNNKEFISIYQNYYSYISNLNQDSKSSAKNYFIVIKYKLDNSNSEREAFINLNDMYFKIKETLSRCGNSILEVDTKEEIEEILFSFYNKNSVYEKGELNRIY